MNINEITRDLKKCFKEKDYLHDGLSQSDWGQFDLRISAPLLGLAIEFLKPFLELMQKQNNELILERQETFALINQQKMRIVLREKQRRITVQTKPYLRTEMQPTGKLAFQVYWNFKMKEWTDEKRPLLDQIPVIIQRMEEISLEIILHQQELERGWAKQAAERAEEKKIEDRIKSERVGFKELLEKSYRWQHVQFMRSYLNTFKVRKDLSPEQLEWLAWAEAKVDWLDPTIEKDDPWLTDDYREEFTLSNSAHSNFKL